PEQDNFAAQIGLFYARVVDEWGIQLQVSGHRPEALRCFDEVVQLNPASVSGRVNQSYDEQLAQGKKATIQPAKNVAKSMEQYNGNWTELLRLDGPIDEPSFRSELGLQLANGWNYRQAIQEFNRVRTIVPDDARVPLQIAQTLVNIATYTNGLALLLPYRECYAMALTNIDAVLKTYPNERFALFLKSFALMQMKAYDRAIEPLTQILNEPSQTNNNNNVVVQLNRAISYYKIGNYDAAKADYEAVGRVVPKAYQVYYGLAEIAYHEKDKPAAIKNYELYLTNAPANTDEAKLVTARLKELKSGAP
ncbi:MAG TPA: tetratricopeptide repeat protein, partial [Verrucomicrobiae bacterium]|nr:tetratricopeptide repeat protein [Verrucomicrobiae bacterium]